MESSTKKALKILGMCLIIIVTLIGVAVGIKKIIEPKQINQIEYNTVYSAFSDKPYKHSPRYYIEFKKDGTYRLMHDYTRQLNRYSGEDEGEFVKRSYEYIEGTFKKSGNTYYLSPRSYSWVCFNPMDDPKNKEVYFKGTYNENEIKKFIGELNDQGLGYSVGSNIYKDGDKYHLSSSSKDLGRILYESDIDEIPDSAEEFLDQFVLINNTN